MESKIDPMECVVFGLEFPDEDIAISIGTPSDETETSPPLPSSWPHSWDDSLSSEAFKSLKIVSPMGSFPGPLEEEEGLDIPPGGGKKEAASPAVEIPTSIARRNTDGAILSRNVQWDSMSRNQFVSSVPTKYDMPWSSFNSQESNGTSPPWPPTTNSTGIGRTLSKKRPHEPSAPIACICTLPDHWVEGQNLFLTDLPTELLLLIFEFAYLSPVKPPRCQHRKQNIPPLRRATESSRDSNNTCLAQPAAALSSLSSQLQGPSADTSASNDDILKLPEWIRNYSAKTLSRIARTCVTFNRILTDPFVDETFWRSAARWCWKLPEKLADIQGREIAHQTSWRNLVGVFMRSDCGKNVESFGGSKECVSAIPWKGEGRHEMEKPVMVDTRRRKLLMVCAQPGPDLFHVTRNSHNGGYTLSLSLRGGQNYLTTINEYGQFDKKPVRLPDGLKRSQRCMEYFPPDIFEVEGNRFQLVKVLKEPDQPMPAQSNSGFEEHHAIPAMKEDITWDLSCVQEFESDPKASVARCVNKDGCLVFNLFTHRNGDGSGFEYLLDPPEDPRLFCVQAFGYPGCQPSQAPGTTSHDSGYGMSEKMRGKMRASKDYFGEPTTIFHWRREFQYEKANDFLPSLHLHYVICNLKLNSAKAVVLIRWNVRTITSNEELVDRQFHILDLKTGNTIRVLQFPNLYWDHRHNDMSPDYTFKRQQKLSRLYNAMGRDDSMGAGNRSTRIHKDDFILTEDKIVCGSHDYCNWVWDLNSNDVQDYSTGSFNAEQNDAGVADLFTVLDDFYWNEKQPEEATTITNRGVWNTNNERAGWWVRTLNQVMCYWHGIAASADGRYFAACKPGKMFVWDLEKENHVVGYQNCENRADGGLNDRWLGRLAAHHHAQRLRYQLRSWFLWKDILPEQGLWLLFDDLETVYLDREDILDACGLTNEKCTWNFRRDDFTFVDGGKSEERQTLGDNTTSEDGEEHDDSDAEGRPDKRQKIFIFGAEVALDD